MNRIYLTLLSIIVFFSCSSGPNTCEEVGYGELFLIEKGSQYCFDDGTELEIVEIKNEFCPCDVTCIWEGQMVVSMLWRIPGEAEIEFIHNSSSTLQNEPLPNDIVVISLDEDITFEEECTSSNPSPTIISAMINVSK